MAFQVNVTFDKVREQQLLEIQERRPDISRSQSEAAKFLLFEYMENILGVKKE